jgi:hypothetical protein
MFEEHEDCFVWRCENCGLRAEFPPSNFFACKDELKARGWRIWRDREGDWNHLCGKCVRKEAKGVHVLDRKPGKI